MSLTYWVAYKHATGDMDGTELTVEITLDSFAGRIEAEKALVKRGVTCPHITGWALRSAADQQKRSHP